MNQDEDYDLLKENLREVLKAKAGKEVLWYILSLCGMYTYIPEKISGVPLGRREVGLDILQLLSDVNPKLYPELLLLKSREEEIDE